MNGSSVSTNFYTNIINLVDYTSGTTYLITIPENTFTLASLIAVLAKYVQASGFGGTANGSVPINIATNGSGAPYYDPINPPSGIWWQWYDTRTTSPKSLGWSRVTTAPDGTNIANRRQLFDLLGLAGHVPSLAGVAGVQGSGYTTVPFTISSLNQVLAPVRFVDVISPQLTPFTPDVNSCATASSGYLARLISSSATGNANPFNNTRVFKVANGATSLRIQFVDDLGNPIPSNFVVPAPYQGALTPGVGILSTTLSNLTFSGISNANTNFPAGTQVNIVTTSGTATGWNPGVYQVQSATSNTVVIPYTTSNANQISNATYGFTIQPVWLTTLAGNQNGPEYTLTGYAIARTTNA